MLRTLGLRFGSNLKGIAGPRTYRPKYRPVHCYSFRAFSTTPRWQSAEDPDEFINAIKYTALFQKLADKPDVLKGFSDLYSLYKELIHELNSMPPPSQCQCQTFEFLTERGFVRRAEQVIEDLNAAGLDPEDTFWELMRSRQGKAHKKDDP